MGYAQLAEDYLQTVYLHHDCKVQQKLNSVLQGECYALQYIASHLNGVIPSEISEAMCISSARVAAMLNSLERKKYITRRVDARDRRRILVELTPEGKQQANICRQEALATVEKTLRLLSEGDAKEYIRITGILVESNVINS